LLEVEGKKQEPFEEAFVEVPEQYVGSVVELFAQRKGG
jgi:GTP-binding protein